MFERFTDRAKRTTVAAQKEARRDASSHIEPSHLLVALFSDDGIAKMAFENLGLHEGVVRRALGAAPPVPFSPATKKVLEDALREALSLGQNYIGPEHILIALSRNEEIARILRGLDVDTARIRSQVARVLSGAKAA